MSEANDLRQKGVKINLDKERHLYFDLNDMCDLEEEYGNLTKALEATKTMKGSRRVLCIALKHEDEKITEQQAAALVPMPRFNEISGKLREALWGSLPKQEKNADAKETK